MIKRVALALLVAGVMLSSCSDYQKLLKNNNYEEKYNTAVELYEKGDYYRALQLFDQVIPVYRGKEKGEDLSFYYAYSYFYQGDYIMASYYFKLFAKNFPSSSRVEEAWFKSAECKYLQSPKYSLDQTSTNDAIEDMQAFANRYPNSIRLSTVNELIDKLRAKLEKKSYEKAELYFRMENYQSAVVSFENLLANYPDTEYREISLFKILKARYVYAKNSVYTKQEERYQETVEAYDKLITFFPESNYIKDAKKYHNEAMEFLQ